MIEVIELSKRYRRRPVLKGVSFTVEKGQITCLAGLNGSGKSTILKAIMGLVPPDGGEIRIDGELPGRSVCVKVSFIPDHLTMPASLRLSEALQFMADFYRDGWNRQRAEELM